MVKRPKKATDLPERFEDLAAKVTAPEPKPDVRPMGGMEKTKWSGLDMWRCTNCHATVWDEVDAKVHTCRRPKFADEAEE